PEIYDITFRRLHATDPASPDRFLRTHPGGGCDLRLIPKLGQHRLRRFRVDGYHQGTFSAADFFSNPTHCLPRQIGVSWKNTTMKSSLQVAFVSLTLVLMSLTPTHAFALRTSTGAHARSQTYHDRTPRVRIHGTHPHRG